MYYSLLVIFSLILAVCVVSFYKINSSMSKIEEYLDILLQELQSLSQIMTESSAEKTDKFISFSDKVTELLELIRKNTNKTVKKNQQRNDTKIQLQEPRQKRQKDIHNK